MSREHPSHKCFVVEDRGEGKDAIWTRIGSAWPHKDGKGFNVQLSALPSTGGRVVLREVTKEEVADEEGRSPAESRIAELTRVASAGPGEPELQLAEQLLRTGVGDALSKGRKGRRKSSETA